MEVNENKPTTNEYLDENNRFKVGNPGGGRLPDTPEQKLIKKARKQLIEEYKDALAEALPMLSPILIAKAMDGDVPAIKELHDRTMDKASQPTDITSKGEKIMILPAELINKNDPSHNPENSSTGQA